MKMTMHIDEALLKRVMEAYECESKTEAVDMALREMDRVTRLRHFAKHGLGLTPDELRNSVAPGYDPKDLSSYDPLVSKVAEDPVEYGK
jgi:hypothetical protein